MLGVDGFIVGMAAATPAAVWLAYIGILRFQVWRARKGVGYTYSGDCYRWELTPRGARDDGFVSPERRAEHLLQKVLGLEQEKLKDYFYTGVQVQGGATGHIYKLYPRFTWPIIDETANAALCGGPYNGYTLPYADLVLARALYLKCPQTERQFLKLCNKSPNWRV